MVNRMKKRAFARPSRRKGRIRLLGGHVRRLLTMSAKDFDAVLDARAEALNAMPSEAYGPGAAFSKICGKHEDYLWDIVHEKQAGS